eukprot:5653450-Pleurochrysis_carterae.AAC.1
MRLRGVRSRCFGHTRSVERDCERSAVRSVPCCGVGKRLGRAENVHVGRHRRSQLTRLVAAASQRRIRVLAEGDPSRQGVGDGHAQIRRIGGVRGRVPSVLSSGSSNECDVRAMSAGERGKATQSGL